MNKFRFRPNILPGTFSFLIGNYDAAEARAYLDCYGIKDTGNNVRDNPIGECYARCYYPEEGYPVVWLSKAPHSPEDIGSMVHELEHAVMFQLNWLGITHNRETTEVYAYLLDRLTTGVLDIVWNQQFREGWTDANTFEMNH